MRYDPFEHVNEFIAQAKFESNNLKRAHYPKEYRNLNIKTSFGIGGASKIPWISFLDEGMSTSAGYYPVFLYYKELRKLILSFGESETFTSGNIKKDKNKSVEINYRTNWSESISEKYTKIEDYLDKGKVYRYGSSYVYKSYDININDKYISLTINDNLVQKEDIQKHLDEIINLYENDLKNASNIYREFVALEGGKKLVSHYIRERNGKIINKKKSDFKKKFGKIFCQICNFSFNEKYGSFADDYIECHHLNPISESIGISETRLEDLILLCANCHRMLHKSRVETLSPQSLIKKIRKNENNS